MHTDSNTLSLRFLHTASLFLGELERSSAISLLHKQHLSLMTTTCNSMYAAALYVGGIASLVNQPYFSLYAHAR